jgi:DOPA 4,5-dioxygenase
MAAAQTAEDPARITGYHAHVYYDAATRSLAAQVREGVEQRFDVRMGRWHDAPIGPHPCASYQIAFAPGLVGELVSWLALNRQGLTVFIHPETGNAIADHSEHVIWLGESRKLNLDALR